jgi:hypothetical protein
MIKTINNGYGINISGASWSDPYISPGAVGAGMVRWNSNMGYFEINDGFTWKQINWSYPTIALTPEVQELLEWVKQKRKEDEGMLSLPDDHPAVKIAKENLNRAKVAVMQAEEQLKTTLILSQNE